MSLLTVLVLSTLALTAMSSPVKLDTPSALGPLRKRATSTWTSLGCYTDNVSGRALPNGETVPGGSGAMTNEVCQTACAAAGYNFAGTEYGGECWCGTSITNGGGPAPDGNAGCTMPCNGNSGETCGGPNRLTLFSSSPAGASSAAGAASSASSSASASPSGTSPSPPATNQKSTSPSEGKRGLAYSTGNTYGNATYANLFTPNLYPKISWGYNWGFPSFGLDPSIEFVPMLWGLPSASADGSYAPDPSWTAAATAAGVSSVLAFNEPDVTYSGSSNILPAAAAEGWKKYFQPLSSSSGASSSSSPSSSSGPKLGTPSILWNNDAVPGSSSGGPYNSRQWTTYFMGNCSDSCRFDFAAIHYYQSCTPLLESVAWFQGNVSSAHAVLALPIWITEFQCYGSEDEQVAFLELVLPWLDDAERGWVQRYAYFGAFPGYLVDEDGMEVGKLGVVYATT